MSSNKLPLLPPCKICGDKSTGLHYGATTCESCKAFFLRCLRTKREITCVNNETCQILLRRPKAAKCTKCRYERCLAAGMSKIASKNGRHTHKAKTKYILEAKAFEKLQNFNQSIVSSGTNNQEQHQETIATTPTIDPLSITLYEPDIDKKSSSDRTENSRNAYTLEGNILQPSQSNEELEAIIKHLVETHYQYTECTPQFLEGKELREREYLEQLRLEKELFGERRTVSKEEYIAARKSTGLDIDNRQELVNKLTASADGLARQTVNFAKSIPSFLELDIDDQATIVKNAIRNGAYFIMHYQMFNPDKNLYHLPNGTLLDRNSLLKLYREETIDTLTRVVKKMYSLNLSDQELVLTGAVCMLLADQYVLKQPEKVDKCLDKCMDCLIYLTAQRKPSSKFLLPTLVSLMTESRTAEHYMETAKQQQETFNLEFNQIWHEILNT